MLDRELLPTITRLRLPAQFQVASMTEGLQLRLLLYPQRDEEVTLEAYKSRGQSCRRVLARTASGDAYIIEFCSFSGEYEPEIIGVIRSKNPVVEGGLLNLQRARFLRDCSDLSLAAMMQSHVRSSWQTGINYRTEVLREDGNLQQTGLRKPQIGALHAIAAHWTLSHEPAIVIMPTGTGKTEVMIASTVASQGRRILVIVPTDALRQQTAEKFQSYGLLKRIGIIDDLPNPVVGVLSSKPQTFHFVP